MGKGKKMAGGSFMSKHAKNLLNYMPIDDRAGSGSDSDLNYNGSPLNDKGDHKHPHSTIESIKSFGRKTVQSAKDFINDPRWEGAGSQFKASVNRAVKGQDPTSKTAKVIYGGDIKKSKDYFKK